MPGPLSCFTKYKPSSFEITPFVSLQPILLGLYYDFVNPGLSYDSAIQCNGKRSIMAVAFFSYFCHSYVAEQESNKN